MVLDHIRAKVHVKNDLVRALLAEFTGTFLLLLIGNSAVAQHVLKRPQPADMVNVYIGFALAILFGVAVSAKISGGHINPAVSLMFLTFKQLSPLRFVLYTIVQTLGAFFGALVSYAVYCDAINHFDGGNHTVVGPRATAGIFASYPSLHLSNFNGLLDQIVGTAVFCFLIAHVTDKRNSYASWLQPVLVGTAFLGVGVAFGYNAGFPMNPARDFGPRLFTLFVYGGEVFSHKNWFWVPVLGPFIGAVLGGWLYQFLIGFHTPQDVEEKYVVLTGNQELKPLTGKEVVEAEPLVVS
ncbi:unnamed protein product [Caenorhabditis auriculariae]|uniref:Uncharacterized protein n=1 Tax=Caenorhabditis auriculariae TaxID=2777116 RepID=A0A8S1HGN6_9PELO|nr:unnamed protein product [Caenorhabditis auriculariae]